MTVDLLEAGRLLGGRYRIVGRIGAGGMGVVFSAYDEATADVVAIKTMLGPLVARAEIVARFRREARIASRIEHPAVVRTLDVGETDDGAPYLVMELLEGMSLASILDDGVKLPLALSVAIVRHALSGVVAAHEAGVIHRDLKPDNLFLHRAPDRDGAPRATVKLVDFGVSKATDLGETMLTRTGGVIGTPFYMAPEQASGEQVDPRVDVYAMGAVAYELVCGERAFGDKHGAALMVDILKGAKRPILSLAPETPESLVAWIDRAMATRREDRFATAAAASEALQESVRAVSTGALTTDDDAFSASLGKLIAPGRRAPEVAMQSTLPGRPLRRAEGSASTVTRPDADTRPDVDSSRGPIDISIDSRVDATPQAPSRGTPAASPSRAFGPLHALVLGAICSVLLGLPLVRLEALPGAHAGGEGAASQVLGAALVGLAWLFVAAMAGWIRRDALAKPLLRIAISEAVYSAFLVVRELAPSFSDLPIVSILGHGSNMVALSSGLWLAARVMRLEGPRIEQAIRLNEGAALAIAAFTGTRWWSFHDAAGLHAGPLMYAMTPFGVGTGIVLGLIIVARASQVADVDRRRRQRATGLGFIVYGLAKGTHAARYMGMSTQAFALAGLISPALLAYGALSIDAVIATRQRGREGALRLVQSAALALVAVFVSAFAVILARDWCASSSLLRTCVPAVSAIAELGLAASLLRAEVPSTRSVLLGAVLAAIGAQQLSIVTTAFATPAHVLWMTRASHAAMVTLVFTGTALIRRVVGRARDPWIERLAAASVLVLAPVTLAPGYVDDTRAFWFGTFAQASWMFAIVAIVMSAMFVYGTIIALRGVSEATGAERQRRVMLGGGGIFLVFCCLGDVIPFVGFAVPPSSDLGFIAAAVLATALGRESSTAMEPAVRRGVARAVGAGVIAIGVVAAIAWAQRLVGDTRTWLGATAIAVVLLVAIDPARAAMSRLLDVWLGAEALDERAAIAVLTKLATTALPHADLVRAITTCLRESVDARAVTLLEPTGDGGFSARALHVDRDDPTLPVLRRTMLPLRCDGARDDARVPASLRVLGEIVVLVPAPALREGSLAALLVVVPSLDLPLRSRRARDFLAEFAAHAALVLDHARLRDGDGTSRAPPDRARSAR